MIPFKLIALSATLVPVSAQSRCRNQPGSPGYPSVLEWSQFNHTLGGALVEPIPFNAFCKTLPGGQCTSEQYSSVLFREKVPGAMGDFNWEQDYKSNPPSLCLQGTETCGQGNVPVMGVIATSTKQVQDTVNFARENDLRLVIKASGHDYQGRSTAKNSLLLYTRKLQNVTFTDHFRVGGVDKGPAVTIGSGLHLRTLYQATKVQGRYATGGYSTTVAPAGGYFQGGGHSPMSPLFGLTVDNVLEFNIVVASGALLRVNEKEHSDLFWAMRGGGPGSWGVVISATFRTFPTFNVVYSEILIQTTSNAMIAAIAKVHAKHIFDLDVVRGGQYLWAIGSILRVQIFAPKTTVDKVTKILAPFLKGAQDAGGVIISNTIESKVANDVFTLPDDATDQVGFMGSRLLPSGVYRDPEVIGELYKNLLNSTNFIISLVVGTGKVSENANVSDIALNPKWRTAKTHMIIVNSFAQNASIEEVAEKHRRFQDVQLPLIERAAGTKDLGSYINEADTLEPNFKKVFYGPNYARLSNVKRKYDPKDLFIVNSGVGSERWDSYALCRV